MAETPVTFSPDAARRIIRAVKAVEQGGVVGPQYRRALSDRPDKFRWMGLVTAKLLADHAYTVVACTIEDGVPTAIAEGEYGYITATCYHADGIAGDDDSTEIRVGALVEVVEAWDAVAKVVYPIVFAPSIGTRPAKITAAGAFTQGSSGKWMYSITFGTYSESGVFTLGDTTSYAINTFETGNTSATLTGGDGVIVPPSVGTLTRSNIPVGSIVMVTKVAHNLWAFTATNPYIAACE